MAQAAASRKRTKTPEVSMGKDDLLRFYHDMLLIRRFEEKAGQLYGMGLIGGFCHLYIGQEAVVVGMQIGAAAGRRGHHLLSRPRPHAGRRHGSPQGVMAELTGRAGGYSHGKGGSMHMFSKEKNFFGGHGIVGAQVPIGTGLGFANWYRGNDRVCRDLFRRRRVQPGPGLRELQHGGADEAAGGLSSSRTTATAWAPASSAPRPRTTCPRTARAWGIPGMQVDGMDVLAVQDAARAGASPHCRAGKGPYLLEMKTYRYRGHSMSDPAQVPARAKKCRRCAASTIRIEHVAAHRSNEHGVRRGGVQGDRRRGRRPSSQDAADFAQSSPEPDPSELWTDILVEA